MVINKNRSTERAAVNALRSLMERHDFIVQEIDGGNDHGEDVYVSFTEDRKRTGDTIFIQIKGGQSYKTANGYRVSIEDHKEYWEKSNAPVFCVVQDPDTQKLFWANASKQLREAKRTGQDIKSIKIDDGSILNDDTIMDFALRARLYISETGDFHKFLANISGVQFDTTDYLAYFENLYGEEIIFRQRRDEKLATLLHSDLDWVPVAITEDDINFTKPARQFPKRKLTAQDLGQSREIPTLRDVILSKSERMWMEACFEESRWIRERKLTSEATMLNTHRVPPILFAPWQELEVANKAWRKQPEVDDLMEKFIELGYIFWQDADEYFKGRLPNSQPPPPREVTWEELKIVARQLKDLKVPTAYIMGNRGRLTRTEVQRICSSDDLPY